MVLDTYDIDRDELIFKNTYDENGHTKQFRIKRTEPNAPEEFYFVHIEVDDMANLPSAVARESIKESEKWANLKSLRLELQQIDNDSSDKSSGQFTACNNLILLNMLTLKLVLPEGFHSEVDESAWIIPQRYCDIQDIGHCRYGPICSVKDTEMEMVRISRTKL